MTPRTWSRSREGRGDGARRSRRRRVLLVAAAILLAACTSESAGGAPIDGEALYLGRCASCHGIDGAGARSGPTLIGTEMDDAAIADAIVSGILEPTGDQGPMPGSGGLSDADVAAIVEYVRTLTP